MGTLIVASLGGLPRALGVSMYAFAALERVARRRR